MSDGLMRIVLEAAAFFELCDDEVLDPDIALKQLEWSSWQLGRLDPEEQATLVAFAEREAEATSDHRYRSFLLAFPEAFGLRDEE
jgi:hypothetical protein